MKVKNDDDECKVKQVKKSAKKKKKKQEHEEHIVPAKDDFMNPPVEDDRIHLSDI